jgi:hypothetical protein
MQVTLAPFEEPEDRVQQDLPPLGDLKTIVYIVLQCLPFLEGSAHAAASLLLGLLPSDRPDAVVAGALVEGVEACAAALADMQSATLGEGGVLSILGAGESKLRFVAEELTRNAAKLGERLRRRGTTKACEEVGRWLGRLEGAAVGAEEAKERRTAATMFLRATFRAEAEGGGSQGLPLTALRPLVMVRDQHVTTATAIAARWPLTASPAKVEVPAAKVGAQAALVALLPQQLENLSGPPLPSLAAVTAAVRPRPGTPQAPPTGVAPQKPHSTSLSPTAKTPMSKKVPPAAPPAVPLPKIEAVASVASTPASGTIATASRPVHPVPAGPGPAAGASKTDSGGLLMLLKDPVKLAQLLESNPKLRPVVEALRQRMAGHLA